MLIKLLKYDLLYGKNGFFGLAAALLAVSLVFRFTMDFFSDAIVPIVGSLIILVVTSIIVSIMSIMYIYQGFSKTFFGNHGYLMFTLPVKHSLLLQTKVLTSTIWLNFMALVSFLSGSILTFGHGAQVRFDQNTVISIFSFVHYNIIGFLALSILFLIITISKAIIRGRSIHFVLASVVGALYFALWAHINTLFFRHVAEYGYFGFGDGYMLDVPGTLNSGELTAGYLVQYDFFFLGSAIVFGIIAYFIILKLFKYMELR